MSVVKNFESVFALDELMFPAIEKRSEDYYATLNGMHTCWEKGPFDSLESAEKCLTAYVRDAFERRLSPRSAL